MNPIERQLGSISGRALRVYRGALFEDSLKMLSGQKQADPDWLAARVENLLLSNGAALVQMRALYAEAEALLTRYRELPEADAIKAAAFDVSGPQTIGRQIAQLEQNEARFKQLLKAIRSAKKQRSMITLSQLLKQISE